MCLLNYFTTNSERIAKHFWQNHSRQFHEFHELWQNDLQISQQIITELKQKAKSMEAQQMTDTWTFVQLSLTRHDQMNWAALGAAVGRELLIEAVLWKSFECLCSSLKSGDKTSTPAWPFHSSGRAIVLQITDIVWGMFKERLKDSLGMGGMAFNSVLQKQAKKWKAAYEGKAREKKTKKFVSLHWHTSCL